MKKKLHMASNKVVARQANNRIKESRRNIIIDQIFQEAYPELIKDPAYQGKTLDEMKNIMMHDSSGVYANKVDRRLEGIAPVLFNANEVFEAPSENSVIIHNREKAYKNSGGYSKAEQLKDALSHSRADFFDRITNGADPINQPKVQTGTRLIEKVIAEDYFNYQRINTSSRQKLHEMDSAYNFFKQSGNIFAFDTETFGGKNYDDISELLTIHDISYIHGNVNDPSGLKEVSFVRGLRQEEADKIYKELENMRNAQDGSSLFNVYRKAAITYSGDINEMTRNEGGLIRMVNPVDYDPNVVYSMEDYKKGLDNLVKINQQYERGANGLTLYEEKVAEMVKIMNGGNHAVLTYNGTYADIPWMNSFIYDTYNTLGDAGKKSFLEQAGLNQMQNLNVKHNLDLMNVLREGSNSDLLKAIYSSSDLSAARMRDGHTALSQEAIVKALLGDAGNAHTSLDDTRNLLKLALGKYNLGDREESLLDYAMGIVQEKHGAEMKNFMQIKPGQGDLFMATKGIGYDGTKGVMSFTYDPVADAYRTSSKFDIGKIGKDGKNAVTRRSYGLNAVRKNQFFMVDDVYRLTTNSENWKEVASQFSELNAQELFVAKITPHYAKGVKGINIGMEQPSYIVAQTKELLEQAISSKSARVGTFINDHYEMAEGAEDLLKVVTTDTAGNIIEGKTKSDLALAVAVQTNNTISDTTRRSITSMTYSRYEKFKEFDALATQVLGEEYQPNKAQKLFNKLALSNDSQVAFQVSKGNVVTVNPEMLQEILSVKNMQTRNEVDNLKHAFSYFKEIQPIAELVNEQVTNMYGNGASRNVAFETVMNNILATAAEELANDSNGSLDIRRAYLNNLTETHHMASDMSGFTFDLPKLFRQDDMWLENPLSVSDRASSITFNLTEDAYSVRKKITERLNPDTTSRGYAKAHEEMIAMTSFMKSANASKQYAGMFEDILQDNQAMSDVDIMANRMLEAMRNAREKSPSIGVRNDILVQNIDKGHQGVKYIKNKYANDLSGFVERHVKEAPRIDIIDSKNSVSDDIINDLIDNYLIDLKIGGKKFTSAEEYINAIGHNGIEAKYFVQNVEQTKQAYRSFITEYVKDYSKGGDIDFVYDFKKHRLVAKAPGVNPLDITQKIPRVVGRGINIHAEQGDMKMAFRGILNMEGFVKGDAVDPSAVKIQSNIAYALEHTLEDMKWQLKKGSVTGKPIDNASYTISNVGKYMFGGKKHFKARSSHISPTTGYSNKEALSVFNLDMKDAYSYIKEIAGMDIMQDKKFVNSNILEVINKYDEFAVGKMTAAQAQYMLKNVNHMLQLALKDNKSVIEVINALNPTVVKYTELNKGVQGVGGAHLRALHGNNQSRPVPHTALLRRSKAETEAALIDLAQKGYVGKIGNVLDLETAHKRGKVGVYGIGEVVDNVTLTKANLSEFGYKTALNKYLKENGNNLPDAVVKKLQAVNLTEQEKVLDGRVADALFKRQQVQRLKDPTHAAEFSEYLDNFKDAMYTITKNDQDQWEFKYSNNGKVFKKDTVIGYKEGYNGIEAMTANYEGRIRYGVFSEGMLVPENEISKIIKGAKDEADAMRIINSAFDDSERFYLDRTGDVGFIKLINGGVEKDMANKMILQAGSVDSDVDDFFRLIGNSDVSTRLYQVDELKNIIDSKYDIYKNAKVEEIKSITGKTALDKADLNSILTKDRLTELALKERYLATDELQKVLKTMGATQNVAIIAAHEQGKHGSTMMSVEEQIATIQQSIVDSKNVTHEDAAKELSKKLHDYKVFGHEGIGSEIKVDGSTMVLPQNWNGVNKDGTLKAFNIENFKQMVKQEGYAANYENGVLTAGQMLTIKSGDDVINVGTVLMSAVSEADDYQGVSTAQNFRLITQGLDGDINRLKTLANATKDPEAKKMYYARIEELKEQKRLVASAAADRQRGRSYGKRDVEMLNMQKYDEGFNQTVKRAFTQGGKFQEDAYLRAMGHQLKTVDGQYVKDEFGNFVLKDGSKSRSVLSDWTKEIKHAMILGGPGDEILDSSSSRFNKRLNQLYADENARETIKKLVKNEGAMSKEYAESVYAFMKGHEASRFNTGLVTTTNRVTGAEEVADIRKRSIKTVEELQERGFQLMKLEEAIGDGALEARDIVDDPNSIFRKNIILDLGEDAGEGNKRYVAMPFVSNKATVSDDFADSHVIQKNFQHYMRSLQHRKQEILELKKFSGNTPQDMKSLEKAVALYQDTADEMRKAIHVDVMGKNGILGQLGVHRAEFSINAKTSSFVYMDENMFGHIKYDDTKKQVLALTKTHLKDNAANYSALNVATIDGMSLAQHYKEGRYFNTRFAGNQLFEEMGLYKDYFVADQLNIGLKEFHANTDEYMSQYKELLKTKGVMVDTVRYPTIKAGSTGPSMLYLDDTIDGLMTKVSIEGQLAYTGDNDGDSVASNLIFKRNQRGKIITSLNAESDDKLFNAASSFMHYRAAGANRYWRKEAENIVYKSFETANSNGDINSMLKGDYLLTTHSGVASLDDVNMHRQNLEELLSIYNDANEKKISIADIHNDKDVAGMLDTFIEKSDIEDKSKYLTAYGFERQHGKMFMDMHAKDIVNYTGHVNVPLFRQREIMDLRMVADETADTADQALLNRAFGSIEQKIISSKKIEYSDASADSFSAVEDRIEKFTTALNNIYYNRSEGETQMRRWLTENEDVKKALLGDAEELMHEDGHFGRTDLAERFLSLQSKLGEELSDDVRKETMQEFNQVQDDVITYMTDKVVDSLSNLNSDQLKNMKSRYAMGVLTEYGDGTNTQQLVDFLGDEGIYSDLLKRMKGAGADVETISDYAFKSGRSHAFDIAADEVAAFTPESRQVGKKVLESTVDAISHMKPSGLGIGALAVAASVLAVGAVGGNPSQATGMEAAQAAQVGMQDLDMMGPQAQAQTTQTNTGYVINVRGRGNRASINRASQQIARTMSGSFSNDVNINMNISEDSTAINDRFLEQVITDAIL